MPPSAREQLQKTLQVCIGWCEKRGLLKRSLLYSLGIGVAGGLFFVVAFSAPRSLQTPHLSVVRSGATVSSVALQLKSEGVIRSAFWFTLFAKVFNYDQGVIAGSYFFPDRQNLISVAWRFTSGSYQLTPVRVTIPEGTTRAEMLALFTEKLSVFDGAEFLSLTEGKEGYLFPDTYFFLPGESAATVAQAMESNFYAHIAELESDITAFGKSLHDVITMASLLEEEARQYETRQIISGILWKRIEIGMRLQVDAVFPYIIGKNTFQVSEEDLKYDSPYNTYRYEGLPLGPITNPGVDAIRAAITPITTNYLFYLADRNGVTHYSRTFEEHVRKKKLYLGS